MKLPLLLIASGFWLLVSGCGSQFAQQSTAKPQLYTVAAPKSDYLTLTIEGMVDNRQPVGHGLPLARVPIKSLHPEGEEIAEGETLAELDPEFLRLRIESNELEIGEQRAAVELARTKTASALSDMRKKRDELQAWLAVYDVEIKASAAQDANQLAIASLELANAEQSLALADARLKEVSGFSAAGHASAAQLQQAIDQQKLAAAAAEQPRLRYELIKESTGWLTRARLEVARAKTAAELGSERDNTGIYSEIKSLEMVLDKQDRIQNENIQNIERDTRTRREVADRAVIAAQASGLVRYRGDGEDSVKPGAKLTESFFAYVLRDDETVVTFALPERWRDLVQPWNPARPEVGLVDIMIQGESDQTFGGRILSIASVPEDAPHGAGRMFSCAVRIDEGQAQLRIGAHVSCALRIPLGEAVAVIPTWCVSDLRRPTVSLSDGSSRALKGFSVGHDFVVYSGLAPGERIAVAAATSTKASSRLAGIVQAANVQPIRMSSGDWEVMEVIPDGSRVEAGDIIAKLSKTSHWQDTQAFAFSVEYGTVQAQANLAIARINAERDLAKALVSWNQAALDLDQARLERLVERYATNDEELAASRSALVQSEVRLAQAKTRAQDLGSSDNLASLSENDRQSRRIGLRQAEISRRQAQLTYIATLRFRDYLVVRDSEETLQATQEQAAIQRTAYSIARSRFQSALASAQVRYRDELNARRRDRDQIADSVVRAPRAGRVYQRLGWNGRLLTVGDELRSWEPFEMPIGDAREFTVEAPARLFGQFHVGDEIDFVMPALGLQSRRGTVSKVGSYFAISSADKADRGTVAVPDRVFLLTISFQLGQDEVDKAPPGTTAYVDL